MPLVAKILADRTELLRRVPSKMRKPRPLRRPQRFRNFRNLRNLRKPNPLRCVRNGLEISENSEISENQDLWHYHRLALHILHRWSTDKRCSQYTNHRCTIGAPRERAPITASFLGFFEKNGRNHFDVPLVIANDTIVFHDTFSGTGRFYTVFR